MRKNSYRFNLWCKGKRGEALYLQDKIMVQKGKDLWAFQ